MTSVSFTPSVDLRFHKVCSSIRKELDAMGSGQSTAAASGLQKKVKKAFELAVENEQGDRVLFSESSIRTVAVLVVENPASRTCQKLASVVFANPELVGVLQENLANLDGAKARIEELQARMSKADPIERALKRADAEAYSLTKSIDALKNRKIKLQKAMSVIEEIPSLDLKIEALGRKLKRAFAYIKNLDDALGNALLDRAFVKGSLPRLNEEYDVGMQNSLFLSLLTVYRTLAGDKEADPELYVQLGDLLWKVMEVLPEERMAAWARLIADDADEEEVEALTPEIFSEDEEDFLGFPPAVQALILESENVLAEVEQARAASPSELEVSWKQYAPK